MMSIKSNPNTTLNAYYNVNSSTLSLRPYPSALPYRVIEALSASSRALKNLSVRISDSGWAWLVSGRRLFVWRYLDESTTTATTTIGSSSSTIISSAPNRTNVRTSKCYELMLPPSDIAHRAELICILCANPFASFSATTSGPTSGGSTRAASKFPAALAVSPEGTIRYWPNIAQEANAIDSIVNADLQGQECSTLIDIQPLGCVLGTTTSSLVHLYVETSKMLSSGGNISAIGSPGVSRQSLGPGSISANPIRCRTLTVPQGLLSGIGRRVSSFIFGSPLPTAHSLSADSKQLIRVARNSIPFTRETDRNQEDVLPVHIFVLTNCTIQKWTIEDFDSENLDVEYNLDRHIKEAFIGKLWNRATTHHNQLMLTPLDIAVKRRNEISLLVICKNLDLPDESYFGFFVLNETLFTSSSSGAAFSADSGSTAAQTDRTESSAIFKSFRIISSLPQRAATNVQPTSNEPLSSNTLLSSASTASTSSSASNSNSNINTTTSNITNSASSSSSSMQLHRHWNILSSGCNSSDDDDRNHHSSYIYNSSKIYRIIHSNEDMNPNDDTDLTDEIDFQLCNDYLFGAVSAIQGPLLFTFKNGFVSIHTNSNDSICTKQLSISDREYVLSHNENRLAVLKRALQLFIKGEKIRSQLLVLELFPWISSSSSSSAADRGTNANSGEPQQTSNIELDEIIVALSADICDQIPQTDPRWAHFAAASAAAASTAASSSSSLESADYGDTNGGVAAHTLESYDSINYVIITNQLEEKMATHRAFVELLQLSNVWRCLSAPIADARSLPLPPKLMLCEHAEKLIVALNLRKFHSKFGSILDAAIAAVLAERRRRGRRQADKRNEQTYGDTNLTDQDLFYRAVTSIDDIFFAFIELQTDAVNQTSSSSSSSHQLHSSGAAGSAKLLQLNRRSDISSSNGSMETLILSITDIVTSVFADVCAYRRANGAIYEAAVAATAPVDCDYVPWSSAEHVSGVRETLRKQFELLISCWRNPIATAAPGLIQSAPAHATTSTASEPDRHHHQHHHPHDAQQNVIAQKVVDLADIILDGYVSQLANLRPAGEKYATLHAAYVADRFHILMHLLRRAQYERAASLAEKYEDFEILIQICEELNNREQLDTYSVRFADRGFAERLFEWYLREGKQAKMLATVSHDRRLANFLSNHESLNWLHQIHLTQYAAAAATLKKLAAVEEMYPGRRRTLLSIGKLSQIAAAAAAETNETRNGDHLANSATICDYSEFDDSLRLLRYQQESLSDALLRSQRLDRAQLKVLSPEQLIDILTGGRAVEVAVEPPVDHLDGGDIEARPNEELRNFQTALRVAAIIEKRYSLQMHRDVLLKIWRRAFLKNDWTKYSTDSSEIPIKQSFFYQLAATAFAFDTQDQNGTKLSLPPIQDLLSDFVAISNDEKARFFLQAAYELIYSH